MGRRQFTPIQVKSDFKLRDALRQKPDFDALVKNNPTLQKLIAQKNEAAFGLRASYANFSPTLSGQAGASKTNSYWPPQDDKWNLGLTLSFPIFEGGLRLAQVSQAQALLNQLKADERSTKDSLVVALEQNWAALEDALETVEVQKKFLTAAEERSKIAEAQYSLGLINFDNWTIIEDDLVGTKKSYLDTQADALLAEANWIQAKGETLEYAD
jgi:outer membrane protein TolC